jgi:hypothetical protein
MMRGDKVGQINQSTETQEKVQTAFCEILQLNAQTLTPQIKESLQEAINLAQVKDQYPIPGQWTEEDFKQYSKILMDELYSELNPGDWTLTQDLKDQTRKAILEALGFLEKAALCDPPANLICPKEGHSFQSGDHEAAKGWEDEGKIVKPIYPAYFVNKEAKVKAVVLTTAPSVQKSDNALPSNPTTNTSSCEQSESIYSDPTNP